ncbi:murein hydrolase activator EnvC family protein [Halomonas caseinilytica]|uniref:Septal ring factor EnvC, activator of murein hydrolases AmiA and AmiB n=1 Tax=Halomonas caseinilytica TaxID=438744 RepID=A0A1M6WAX7_9GAMM|nr:Septal ring factor EnvC, activator of murein hydrolases AmiA and AmiB [Halomonas caseinilytica]SHK90686.1 Septal ring factor EnvC, activator of murein hydrolases AmiA and AmiB [Halomonas caseinilytica]
MSKAFPRREGVCRLLPLVLWLAVTPAMAVTDEREAQQRIDAIGERIQEVTRELDATGQARDEASEALREIETSLAETHRRLDDIQAQRRALNDEVIELEEERKRLEAERQEQLAALEQQVDALYRLGLTPQLKLLLNQDDPGRLDRLQTYLNRLAEARNARLAELDRLDTALDDNQQALDERGQRLEQLAGELEKRSAELASQVDEREALLAKLDERYATKEARLSALDQDRAHAEQVLQQVQERLARLERPPPSTAISETRGDLPWPVQGKVTSTFRQGRGVHRDGMLIRAAAGTPVEAVHAGRVVFADWMRGFGNLLIIDHGDGVMTLHAHLQHFSVEVGAAVDTGQTIGVVGASGGQPSPGLYFEVRRAGDPIDPQSWVAQR